MTNGPVFRQGTLLMLTGPVEHLHIVMNDPIYSAEHRADVVLVVNVSSVKPGVFNDPACLLAPGCHPFVVRDSFVFYKQAVVLGAQKLTQGCLSGDVRAHVQVAAPLFQRIRDGFDISDFVPFKISRFIRVNGL